jgi:hypothetical protein
MGFTPVAENHLHQANLNYHPKKRIDPNQKVSDYGRDLDRQFARQQSLNR